MNTNDAIQLAIREQKSGNLKTAEDIYLKILEIQPHNVSALHFLGLLYYEKKDTESALHYIRESLRLEPDYLEAVYNLGMILKTSGKLDEALLCFKKALHIKPDYADALSNIGAVLQAQGIYDEAIINYNKALNINPELYEVYKNIGYIFREKGMTDEAIAFFSKALQIQPDLFDVYNYLGLAFQEKGNTDEAVTCFRKAIALKPDLPELYNNLGTVLRKKGLLNESIGCFAHALILNNKFLVAYSNIAVTLKEKGDVEASMQFLRKALKINPDFASAHWNLALQLLLTGNYDEGWQEYKWFWKLEDTPKFNFPQPLWDGSDINGKTILLYSEQGYGDAIQFIRYIPLLTKAGAEIILLCQNELKPLFLNSKDIKGVFSYSEQLPPFDIHCSLLMLPAVFQTNTENIPAAVPYLGPRQTLADKWHDKTKRNDSKLKVGIVWSGGHKESTLHFRSCSLDKFSSLSSLDGIAFYSLQKGTGSEQAKNPPQNIKLIDYTDCLNDFEETAAFILNLDLIISVDTSVAHLAGALGKTVWTLLPFSPDWRWMLNREDSPWYPTMRLFRQQTPGDWDGVFRMIYNSLNEFINLNRKDALITTHGY